MLPSSVNFAFLVRLMNLRSFIHSLNHFSHCFCFSFDVFIFFRRKSTSQLTHSFSLFPDTMSANQWVTHYIGWLENTCKNKSIVRWDQVNQFFCVCVVQVIVSQYFRIYKCRTSWNGHLRLVRLHYKNIIGGAHFTDYAAACAERCTLNCW